MKKIESWKSFLGEQQIWQHASSSLSCSMNVAVYIPDIALGNNAVPCPVVYWLSGLTCTERNFIEKSGFQRYASEHGLIVVAPDTSPRGSDLNGEDIANDDAYDLGQGAGFYVNATQAPWKKHYRMYDYIVEELPKLIGDNFNTNGKQSIMGHSMGGHGALTIALQNPEMFASVSAFSPIVAPTQVPWGKKAFNAYLGDDQSAWLEYDAAELLAKSNDFMPILIEQGLADNFLIEQLRPELIEAVAKKKGLTINVNRRDGFDHSYYFIASFIGEHFMHHATALTNA